MQVFSIVYCDVNTRGSGPLQFNRFFVWLFTETNIGQSSNSWLPTRPEHQKLSILYLQKLRISIYPL